jgi:hypothetical protein
MDQPAQDRGDRSGRTAPRRHRPWLVAVVVGVAVAALTAALAPPESIPPSWTAALLPGISGPEDVVGQSTVEVALRGEGVEPRGDWRRALRARLEEGGARLVEDGRALRAELPGVRSADALDWVRAATRPGRLEFRLVEDGSPFMRALFERVRGDPRAEELGVTGDVDVWSHEESQRKFQDWHLEASERGALLTYLREQASTLRELGLEPGMELVLEHVERPREGEIWRTYYVDAQPALTNQSVAQSDVYWNETTARPEVLVEFTAEGAQAFAEWTGRAVGHKIAILLDGLVTSAPVVQTRIDGGRSSITMDAGTAKEALREAEALVHALETPLQPFEVDLGAVAERGPVVTAAELQAARALVGVLVGAALGLLVFLLELRTRPIDPAVAPAPGRSRGAPWRKLAVTLGGIALVAVSRLTPAKAALTELLEGRAPDSLSLLDPSRGNMFAVGIHSVLLAYLLAESAALLVPRWRHLRIGTPAERAHLGVAVAVLSCCLTVLHAYLLTRWWYGFGRMTHPMAPLVIDDAADFWSTMALLIGGTTAFAILALLIDRYGLVNGFAAVLLAGIAFDLAAALHRRFAGELPWQAMGSTDDTLFQGRLLGLGTVALAIAATSAILRWRPRSTPGLSHLRPPTAGVVPLAVATSVAPVLARWPAAAWLVLGAWSSSSSLLQLPTVRDLVFLLIAAGTLSWCFSLPSHAGRTATLLEPSSPRQSWVGFALATALSTAYLIVLFALDRLIRHQAPWYALDFVGVALATATVMDAVGEWRARWRRGDLVPAWPLHQVQRAGAVLDELARQGIDAHARGLYLRSLLHFFGPFVPILILVPADRRADAAAVIRAVLDLPGEQVAEPAPDVTATPR